MWRIAILLLAACSDPPKQAFVVDGFVTETSNPNASVIGVWELAGSPPKYYKHGDGVRLDGQFTLGFETDPPPAALNPDGVGVAFAVMLPELTTVPDGPVNLQAINALGISAGGAVIYRAADSDGPAWSDVLPPRFSCARCVRGATLDTYELSGCASVLIESVTAPLCRWF
jgi:hypothetical protein